MPWEFAPPARYSVASISTAWLGTVIPTNPGGNFLSVGPSAMTADGVGCAIRCQGVHKIQNATTMIFCLNDLKELPQGGE